MLHIRYTGPLEQGSSKNLYRPNSYNSRRELPQNLSGILWQTN